MLIQIISDMHIEFRGLNFKNILKPAADVLCLAGDICAMGVKEDYENFVKFLEYICPKYKYIIHVPGNHEYYTAGSRHITKSDTMGDIDLKLQNLTTIFKNYFYLNCRAITITHNEKKYVFIGAALWAYVKPQDYKQVSSIMNDYKHIYTFKNNKITRFTIQDMQELHFKHLSFIEKACKKAKKYICVLITHHKPTGDTINRDIITQAYETDITKYITPNVKISIHGHTHTHYDKTINGTRYVSNPLGYPREHTKFIKDFVINI